LLHVQMEPILILSLLYARSVNHHAILVLLKQHVKAVIQSIKITQKSTSINNRANVLSNVLQAPLPRFKKSVFLVRVLVLLVQKSLGCVLVALQISIYTENNVWKRVLVSIKEILKL